MSDNKEHMKSYMKERYYLRRASAIEQLGGVCVVCGTDEDLHFDHIDPSTKLFTIGRKLAGVAEHKLQEELKKCQLLCEEHHKAKSLRDGSTMKNRASGVRVNHAKLDDAKVKSIRDEYDEGGTTYKELAERYGVTHRTIGQIVKRNTWKHVV